MFSMGLMTFIIAQHKSLAHYLSSYASALMLMSASIFFATVLSKDFLIQYSSIVALIFFLSCALHTQAIYQRLHIQFLWQRCIYLICFGTFSVYFFTAIYPAQPIRIFIIGAVTAALFLHRPWFFVQTPTQSKIDHALKLFSYSLALIALVRAIVLVLTVKDIGFIGHYPPIWAFTQLVLILFNFIFLGLFIACAMFDIIFKLNLERNLDPLTGLLNRRGLDEHLDRIRQLPIENHAILIADLDHFKRINDQYGHHVGDLVLQHISRIFQQNVREHDQVSRIGGEEFLLVLHNIHHDAAIKIANRMRATLEQTPVLESDQVIHLTMSIGVSFFNHPDQIEQAFLEADQLLYHAKKLGRNQIQHA